MTDKRRDCWNVLMRARDAIKYIDIWRKSQRQREKEVCAEGKRHTRKIYPSLFPFSFAFSSTNMTFVFLRIRYFILNIILFNLPSLSLSHLLTYYFLSTFQITLFLFFILGSEPVYAVSYSLTLVGDDAARADGVTLLPLNKKWTALALECGGIPSDELKLTAGEELKREEVCYILQIIMIDLLLFIL